MTEQGTADAGTTQQDDGGAGVHPDFDKAVSQRQAAKAERDAARKDLADARAKLAEYETAQAAQADAKNREAGDFAKIESDYKSRIQALEEMHAEAAGQIQGFTNLERERQLLDGLAGKFDGVSQRDLKREYLLAIDEGKLDRYPEKPGDVLDDVAKALLEQNPNLTKRNAGPSGGSRGNTTEGAAGNPGVLGKLIASQAQRKIFRGGKSGPLM